MAYYLWVLSIVLLAHFAQGMLYGYSETKTSKELVVLDPATGYSKTVCSLSSLPSLSGASSSANIKDGLLYFYHADEDSDDGNITLVKVNPRTCKVQQQHIEGLNVGQNEVRDIKYDNVNGKLYMVFPDPNCLHGSFDKIETDTATVSSTLTNLVDPVGLSQTASISPREEKYYYIGLPFPPINPEYLLNVISLPTGDSLAVNLVNNNLGLGNMWDTNFTLNVHDSPTGVVLVGAVSPDQSDSKGCYPSGFYAVNTVNGTVTCTYGPINMNVFPLAEIDAARGLFYQIFTDKTNNYFLFTFDVVKRQVVSQVACAVCKYLSVLTLLP